MINFGYNNRWVRLIKDLLFVGLGVWLITRSSMLAVLLGIFALAWYGRDAWFQSKALWQEKHYQPKEPSNTPKPAEPDGKITVTDLSDAKEVPYTKED